MRDYLPWLVVALVIGLVVLLLTPWSRRRSHESGADGGSSVGSTDNGADGSAGSGGDGGGGGSD